jgi:type I site-specific restriction endonuclease
MMSLFDDADVISGYTLDQAIKDGILVEVFKNL